jgi:hypothetical protein
VGDDLLRIGYKVKTADNVLAGIGCLLAITGIEADLTFLIASVQASDALTKALSQFGADSPLQHSRWCEVIPCPSVISRVN